MLCGSLDGRGVWGRMDTCMYMAESLCCSHETIRTLFINWLGFPSGSVGKESACSAGNVGSISGSGKFPEGGHGTVLQYSCLENPMDRGAWQTTVLGVTKSQTRLQQVSTHTHTQQVVCRRCGEREKRKSYLRFAI